MKTNLSAIILFCVLGGACNAQANSERDSRPNVLLVIADDASRSNFEVYDYRYTETPAFEKQNEL